MQVQCKFSIHQMPFPNSPVRQQTVAWERSRCRARQIDLAGRLD
jgi:hypothetical protein